MAGIMAGSSKGGKSRAAVWLTQATADLLREGCTTDTKAARGKTGVLLVWAFAPCLGKKDTPGTSLD